MGWGGGGRGVRSAGGAAHAAVLAFMRQNVSKGELDVEAAGWSAQHQVKVHVECIAAPFRSSPNANSPHLILVTAITSAAHDAPPLAHVAPDWCVPAMRTSL